MGVFAKQEDLHLWGQGGDYARYDYVSEHYLMSEMLRNDFFCNCTYLLRKGDWIYMTDCEDQIMVVRVDSVDQPMRIVFLSKLERVYAQPVVELKPDLPDDIGLIYRHRPTRAGGHSIVTAKGEVFAINFPTRQEVERAIANCYESKVFEAPHGHEPTSDYVSANSKIYKG